METLVEAGPAEVYDRAFVPALFAQWGPVVAAAAGVAAGARVLDVGCGTGAATVAAAARAGRDGRVVGLDPNPEMLTVARRKPGIEWVEGRAEELPFRDAEFDAVVSQFAMMFFDDRVAALREMQRVLAPGGRMAVAVCGALAASPGYSALAALLDRLFGRGVIALSAEPEIYEPDYYPDDASDPELLIIGIEDIDLGPHHDGPSDDLLRALGSLMDKQIK